MKKIVIIGPESTGKSQLAESLSDHFQSTWVQEYAREYLTNLNRPYVQKDLLAIAKGQLAMEDRLARTGNKFLFCDTNLIVIKIWSDFKYGTTDSWIEEKLTSRSYDFYLLTAVDLPWEDDPMREHPQKRDELFQLYKKYLEDNKLPYGVVSGSGQNRLENAIEALTPGF